MLLSIVLILLQSTLPGCRWAAAVEAGTLATSVNESSGMAVSRRIPNRTYRHNDSGDTGRFFAMNADGSGMRIVNVAGFNPVDAEDMALGPCSASTDCIFIGDIGDNNRRRTNLELVVIEERTSFPSQVEPAYRVRLRYPDGPHDAESLGVHPNGSVYILTKDAMQSGIYRLTRDQWRSRNNSVQTLERVLSLDWTALLPNTLPFTRLATAMDISPDGRRFLVLNYTEAVEFGIDLSANAPNTRALKEGQHYRRIPVTTLEQQEAIAYLPDGMSFLYDTERPVESRPAKIMRVRCVK